MRLMQKTWHLIQKKVTNKYCIKASYKGNLYLKVFYEEAKKCIVVDT